jgi:hypothetical protein
MTDAAPCEEAALATTATGCDGPPSCIAPQPSPASKILPYPPWSTVDPIERRLQIRSLTALAYVYLGPGHPLWRMLRAGETDPMAFVEAQRLSTKCRRSGEENYSRRSAPSIFDGGCRDAAHVPRFYDRIRRQHRRQGHSYRAPGAARCASAGASDPCRTR